MRRGHRALFCICVLAGYGCGQAPGGPATLPPAARKGLQGSAFDHALPAPAFAHGKVQHIIVIVQENRSVDNLFNGFPGADTVRYGKNRSGKRIKLQPVSLTAHYDLSHRHKAWLLDYDNGKMDGFNTEALSCRRQNPHCPRRGVAAYGYVPKSQVKPYWIMARRYVFADRMFATNQGPSFPAHQYIISGTSTISNGSPLRASENPTDPQRIEHQGGCDSLPDATVATIDAQGKNGVSVFPCFDRTSIMDLMNHAGVSWHYYQHFPGSGFWNAVDAIKQIRYSPSYKNVIWPSKRVLTDIADHRLEQVTFVMPTARESDHANHNNGSGPSWVASIVNAIGESSYWNTSVIFVMWDDWGGWYDHVKPVIYNSYELGFRVPLIVIGPYAKAGYVSHRQHEFGSVLKFIEKTFNLGSMGTTDARADDLMDCFDFSQKPRAFTPIPSALGPDYFLRQPLSTQPPDDDF